MAHSPIIASKHFTHYAPQWRPSGGSFQHFDLDGDGAVAVFRTLAGAQACLESVAADLPTGVETRIARYHTSGYTDVAEVPNEPRATGYFDMPEPEPDRPKRHVPKAIEVID